MKTSKRPWREGDEGWEVEWCSYLPYYPDDPTSCDIDNAEYTTRNFRDKESAYAYAREVYLKSKSGDVGITPFRLVRLWDDLPFHIPRNCHKEYTEDGEFYAGEEGE